MKSIYALLVISFITACSVVDRTSSLHSISDSATDRFLRRAESLGALLGARTFIKNAMDESSVDTDRSSWLYMADLYFKTFEFEGRHYLKSDVPSVRIKMYQTAFADLEKRLSPTAIGFPYAGYFYFRSLFLLRIFQDSNEYERLGIVGTLNQSLDEGLSAIGSGANLYAGGGLYRIKALLKAFPGVRGFPGGLWNPEESLRLIDTAISSDGYPGAIYGEILCDNFRSKAEILRQTSGFKKMLYFSAQTSIIFGQYLSDELISGDEIEEAKDCARDLTDGIIAEGLVYKPAVAPVESNEYRYDAKATYTSADKSIGTVTMEAVCGSDIDPRNESFTSAKTLSKDYGPERIGLIETLTISINRLESPCRNLMFFFSGNGLAFKTFNLDVKLTDYGVQDSTFLSSTKAELSARAESLFNHSATMSSLVLARPNLFCDIRSAEILKIDSGLIRKFKNDYLLLFNSSFDSDKASGLFSCPAKNSLSSEMSYCEANPTISTPFCDSYALYVIDLRWVSDILRQTRARLVRLNAETSAIKSELEELESQLQAEIDLSESTYGDLLD